VKEMNKLLTFFVLLSITSTAIAQNGSQTENKKQDKSTLTKGDQLQIAVQKICPVSGDELGTKGDPVKIKAGEQIAFLCCKNCQSKKLSAKHWKTIQTNLATAQGICPIMEKPVDASMKSTVVNGQQIFVCCPPCIEKIQADAKNSIAKVHGNYAAYVAKIRQAKSDQIHSMAQGICPVSGNKLGSKGKPIKVNVGKGETAFLCCKDCVGKPIEVEHWKTIQENLASAQNICPVMGKPVDASMESAIINGRKIFVCCPPCIEKMKADPETFVAKLDAQIVENSKPAKGNDRE